MYKEILRYIQMLQLCGDNEYTQLGISSNDKNIK